MDQPPILKLDNGKRAFQVQTSEGVFRWEYDVLTIKLTAEELEAKFGLRKLGEDKVVSPTPAFLQAFAFRLHEFGLTDCTVDAAFAVYEIVNTQFIQLSSAVSSQINSILAT
ncbi:MAG: hypothetical protein ACK5YR_19035 [Pirellula sp.]|jgi:hypothetical protein